MGKFKKINKEEILNNNSEVIPGTNNIEQFGYELKQLFEKYEIDFHYTGFGFTDFIAKDGSKMGVRYLITEVLGCQPHQTWERLGHGN